MIIPMPINHNLPAPEVQFSEKIQQAGLNPGAIVLDGVIHRFSTKPGDPTDTAGWYLGYSDNVPSGAFGDWRTGNQWTWQANLGRDLSPIEIMQNSARIAEAKRIAEKARAETREAAANRAQTEWDRAFTPDPGHPYLQKKGIEPHIAKIDPSGNLILPLYDKTGRLWSLQYIPADGQQKKFLPGGATKGHFATIGGTIGERVYIAEGFATGATICETTKTPTVIAYSAGNLVPVTEAIRELHPGADIIIVADNDASGVGKNYADQAAAKYGATVIMPPIEGMDANDYKQAGHDLIALLDPPKTSDWLTPIDGWLTQPAPIKWLVKGWIQTPALAMVHGPSGDGKTFVILDMALHIATGKPDWMGCKIKQGNVAYLAGEGHHGLRARVAAWCQKHNERPRNMWVSDCATDINTPAGAAQTISDLRKIPGGPKLVIIDTLHRFLDGDENSAQDAKGMIDACNLIQREFDCTVILVHHTGVSDQAQGRARGSSAWKGAMENEINIKNTDGIIKIEAVKIKDGEKPAPLFIELETVTIEGWIDEDGESVTSAVVHRTQAPEVKEKKHKENEKIKHITDVWYDSGQEMLDDRPYITGSAIGEYIKTRLGKDGANARNYKKRLIDEMIEKGIIQEKSNGFIIIDEIIAGSLSVTA